MFTSKSCFENDWNKIDLVWSLVSRLSHHRVVHMKHFVRERLRLFSLVSGECFLQFFIIVKCFTHRKFYLLKVLPIESFTHQMFYPLKVLPIESFTHQKFYPSKVLPIESFTHGKFYPWKVLTIKSFNHQKFYPSNV